MKRTKLLIRYRNIFSSRNENSAKKSVTLCFEPAFVQKSLRYQRVWVSPKLSRARNRRDTSMGGKLTRRDFVKLSSVAGAALGAGATSAQAIQNPPGWRGSERVERIATNCEMCFWRCGAVAEVSDGKLVRVAGNPDHPLTKGRLDRK